MKIGDKVLVTYTDGDQKAGRLVGETEKMWKIDFDEEGEKRVSKKMTVAKIDDPETEKKEVITIDPEQVIETIWDKIKNLFRGKKK